MLVYKAQDSVSIQTVGALSNKTQPTVDIFDTDDNHGS